MDLFKLNYKKDIELFENSISRRLSHSHNKVYFEKNKFGSYKFRDENGKEWVYSPGFLQINFKNIEAGNSYAVNGTTFIRTFTSQEVIDKAIEYFSLFMIKRKKKHKPNIQLHEKDWMIFPN